MKDRETDRQEIGGEHPRLNSLTIEYLGIACSIRNEEFRLQLQRNAIFTAFHAALAAAAASLLDRSPLLVLPVAVVGLVLGVLWYSYYKASNFWVRYWEQKCAEIDRWLKLVPENFLLFGDHPAGRRVFRSPPEVYYNGKLVPYARVQPVLTAVILLFIVSWGLTVVAVIVCKLFGVI